MSDWGETSIANSSLYFPRTMGGPEGQRRKVAGRPRVCAPDHSPGAMLSHLERSAASTAHILHPALLWPQGDTPVQLVLHGPTFTSVPAACAARAPCVCVDDTAVQ